MIIKTFENFILFLEKDSKMYEYGCLMISMTIPEWGEIISTISTEDLYEKDSDRYGIEIEPHITILYGISSVVSDEEVISLFGGMRETDFDFLFISKDCFFNKDYDVLKINVISDKLSELNKLARENLEHTTQYKDYIPHLTLAYLKKGMGNKYIDKDFTIKDYRVNKIVYSKSNGEVLDIPII